MRTTVDLPNDVMSRAFQIFPDKTKRWIIVKSVEEMIGAHARRGLLAAEGKFPHLKGKFHIDNIRGRNKMKKIQKMLNTIS